jgi:hypothetical protein
MGESQRTHRHRLAAYDNYGVHGSAAETVPRSGLDYRSRDGVGELVFQVPSVAPRGENGWAAQLALVALSRHCRHPDTRRALQK